MSTSMGDDVPPFGPTGPFDPVVNPKDPLLPASTPSEADVYRPTDGLHLRVRYLGSANSPRLVVELDSQHIGEQTLSGSAAEQKKAGPLTGLTAGPSRLVFDLGAGAKNPLGGSLTDLLTLVGKLDLRIPSQAAKTQPKAILKAPRADETALEIPWNLLLAPAEKDLVWSHDAEPTLLSNRATLWHTRLTNKSPGGPTPVRAVWTPDREETDVPTTTQGEPYDQGVAATFPLSPIDRADLVTLTSQAGSKTIPAQDSTDKPEDWPADPLLPQALWLTPLGGTLRVNSVFAVTKPKTGPGTPTALIGYAERAELGRDSYVLAVRDGRLLPFGHQASVTTVSERRVIDGQAVLFERSFVTVTQPVRRFRVEADEAWRRFPFVEVDVLTRLVEVDPALGSLFEVPSAVGSTTAAAFAVRMSDRWGHQVKFALPMVWAATSLPPADFTTKPPTKVKPTRPTTVTFSGNPATLDGWVGELDGTRLVLSDPSSYNPGPPHAVRRVSFSADLQLFPTVQPRVEVLEVEVPGSAEFAGGLQHTEMTWLPGYAVAGPVGAAGAYLVRSSRGVVDAAVAAPAVELFRAGSGASAEATGGLLTPTMLVQGFAHELGVVAGSGAAVDDAVKAVNFAADAEKQLQAAADTAAKLANPDEAAKAAEAAVQAALDEFLPKMKILGVVELGTLLHLADFAGGKASLPKLRRLPAENGAVDTELRFNVSGDRSFVRVGDIFLFERQKGFSLSIVARASTSGPSSLSAVLTNFRVGFQLGDSKLWFQMSELSFTVASGAKPDFKLTFAGDAVAVDGGPLAFIVALLRLVPQEAFADPPDVQIEPSGVRAGYSLGLPPIQLGAFALSNLAFSAGFVLPFLGERPALRLALSSRDNPFGLLVACLGGAGFVAIEVDTAGIRQVEVSLEAQAGLALNLGVAKGKILARAGIYFRLQTETGKPTQVLLEGFVEVSGAVCVLAIMTYSLTANMTLGYDSGPKTVSGRATVKVGVKVLFVKKTVKFAIERTFANAGGDPSFADVFDGLDRFDSYCEAFA